MSIAIVSGSAGLVGASAVGLFASQGLDVIGVDNDMRKYFFGREASTRWNRELLERSIKNYRHVEGDIRDQDTMDALFREYGKEIALIIHAAAQPSHDWAAREPHTDFAVNATGTINLRLLAIGRGLINAQPYAGHIAGQNIFSAASKFFLLIGEFKNATTTFLLTAIWLIS